MIEFINVSKKYKENYVVKNLTCEFRKGEISIIIGPSGCGKTTTLKMVNRLIEPTEGNIFINEKSIFDIDEISLRRSIGYVIQEIGLFPHYTIFENIALVPKLLGWDSKKIKKRVTELMELINLPLNYLEKYPKELSGGEKQRVGVARALAGDPEILLMDEPFGAIDPINRKSLQDFFIEIQKSLKKTVIFVTHDILEALKIGDRILIMKDGEMVQYDKPENILKNPKNSFVEALLGGNKTLLTSSIKKVVDFLKKDYRIIEKNDLEKISDYNENLFLIKENGKITNYILKSEFIKGKACLRKPIFINENENLLETIILLLNKGEKIAIINCIERGIMGYVRLEDMIKFFEKEDELSNK
ncbi:MAG: ABC transporter ATP-binding protein [Caldisericia bacterium]|nr:ABC transporter ATP-binding protein [Caldisericia bacterium]